MLSACNILEPNECVLVHEMLKSARYHIDIDIVRYHIDIEQIFDFFLKRLALQGVKIFRIFKKWFKKVLKKF